MTDNGSPLLMLHYLMEKDFTRRDEGTWFDRPGKDRVIRVVWDGEEDTQVIALAPHSACLYKATFSHDVPHPVITAAIEAASAQALAMPRPRTGTRPAAGPPGSRDPPRGRGRSAPGPAPVFLPAASFDGPASAAGPMTTAARRSLSR